MDLLTVPVVAILARYASDEGLALGAKLGPVALDVAQEMYLLVLDRVAWTRPEIAAQFPNDPETYERPLQQALNAEIAADPGLAARLKHLLARYQQAAGHGPGAAAGAQGMAVGGIQAGRVEAENVVSGVQVQGGSAADAAGLARLAQAVRPGGITADQIVAGHVVSGLQFLAGPPPATSGELAREVAALRREVAQAAAQGEMESAGDAEDAQDALEKAEAELQKPEPDGKRVARHLEIAAEILASSARVAQAAGQVGLQILKLAPIAAALVQLAGRIWG
jgi:hypothetical protein